MRFWKPAAPVGIGGATDDDLIERLVEGDRAAFGEFYERYSQLIYHSIRRLDADLCDDLFQEFFARLQETRFRALQQWGRTRPFPGFLRQVVRNFVLDRLRRERTRRRAFESAEDPAGEVETGEVSAQEAIEMRQLRKGAIKAWSKLSSVRDRRLICVKYFRDLPPAVAAERERLNPGAYRKALFDAQRRYMALVKLSLPEYFS
ncbi:RNA polymerase sigma factor (sigma-70 family) [Roseiarcus fermentans]|uniref:RNA polymerase sigma factor (Sigma-70 family) n=1 Tax=Roseiarcus fermentans TaxID=1473586 RepID=A0A366F544_9HYPH|nr:sigma-70 family RNA polymerase sigma factor [Roseiarcus fermentans]RBP09768.1 RNA polymerase sigma factor (sigma-70 family) [Roseiarcus fermentans]